MLSEQYESGLMEAITEIVGEGGVMDGWFVIISIPSFLISPGYTWSFDFFLKEEEADGAGVRHWKMP